MAKVTRTAQAKYKKGVEVNKEQLLKMITDNLDKMTIEMRERSAFSDDTEELVISFRY